MWFYIQPQFRGKKKQSQHMDELSFTEMVGVSSWKFQDVFVHLN